MKAYRSFRPTACDTPGLGLEDRQDWLVGPVIRTRDSDVLTCSNWLVVLEDLRTCSNADVDLEVHRFGHWGPGWFELILVRPGTAVAAQAQEWENTLADYPVADDSHFSELEHTEAAELWANMSVSQRIAWLRTHSAICESWIELRRAVRGEFFPGEPSELFD